MGDLQYFVGITKSDRGEYEKDSNRLFQMTESFNKADGRLHAIIGNTELDSKVLDGIYKINELVDEAVYIMNSKTVNSSDPNEQSKISETIHNKINTQIEDTYYTHFHNLVSGLIDPIMRKFCFEYTISIAHNSIILNAIVNKELFNLHQYEFVTKITGAFNIFDVDR